MAQHPIGEHALLADGRTAALIDPLGNVAWLCWPRVDSDPCLLGILDDLHGGVFSVAPDDPSATVVERSYLPGTLVLRTVWRTRSGVLTVLDALACDGEPRLLRMLEAEGTVEVTARAGLAPGAARRRTAPVTQGAILRVAAEGIDVTIRGPAPWYAHRGVAECRVTVAEHATGFVLCDAAVAQPSPDLEPTRRWFAARTPSPAAVRPSRVAAATLGDTAARELVRHSAAVLAGLRQRDGGIVAAPTTSLPQWPAGSRTWDYRYSWLRDTALAGVAMARAGQSQDAAGLGDFLGCLLTTAPPPTLARVDGSPPPPETVQVQLRGYGDARPVRFGNAAADQPQLDVAGEITELASALAELDALPDSLRAALPGLVTWAAAAWQSPDHGIWEIRGTARRYTHSRVLAWTALTGGAGLAERGLVAGDAPGWRETAGAIRAAVLGRGGPLTLDDQGGGADASLAQAGLTGFLDPGDPVLAETLDAIERDLGRDGLVERHVPDQDANSERCAPFVFPTFWLAEALERSGRDGSQRFAAAAAARGRLDLFGEVADPRDHSPLGNYPQVQSHAAFVLAATEPEPG